jgi:ketosteroid isomerase-like protein
MEMNKKVSTIAAEMVDREAIRHCLFSYCRGIDRIDADLILSAYWPDATDEHGNFTARSAQEFVDHAVPILQAMEQTKHYLTNILIDIHGDTAYVESYTLAFHRLRKPDGTRFDNLSSGRYVDRMERRDDEWRIKRRVIVRDFFREFMDSAEWKDGDMPKILGYGKDAPLELGLRKPHDRSYELLRHTQ